MTYLSPADRSKAAPLRKLTDRQIDTMRKWHEAGQTYQQLAWFFKVSVSSVRFHCDDVWRQRRLDEKKTGVRRADILGVGRMPSAVENRKIDEDAKRLKKKIPRDTRSLTAWMFGDPLPGRSALDRQQAKS